MRKSTTSGTSGSNGTGMRILVAGGGLAGLTAASRLAEDGHDVTIFERRGEVGGRVRTSQVEEFTLDRGFQVLFPAYPAVQSELDLEALDLRRFAPGGTICRPGHRAALSDPLRDPGGLLESAFNRDISLRDKLRVLALRRELAGLEFEAIASGSATPTVDIRTYLRRRGFSEQFLDNFAEPFYGGITLDRSLSTDARVFAYTFKALSASRAAVPAGGMGAIAEQLADRARDAGATIRLDEPVVSLSAASAEGGWEVTIETSDRTIDADTAVVAVDPKRAAELLDVASIPTAARGCVTQHYTLPEPELDAGTRIMLNAGEVDEASTPTPNTVAQLSAVAPEYAPSGSVLVSGTFLGEPAQEASEQSLFTAARETLTSWYPERSFDALELLATHRIPFAQFAQPPGCHDDLPGPRAPGGSVYLAGDFTRWSSIQGAIESGIRAAAAIEEDTR